MPEPDPESLIEDLVVRVLSADDPTAAERRVVSEYPAHAERLSRIIARLRSDGWTAPYSCEPGARIGPFRIQRTLGAGGMGIVYLARDEAMDRDVALKLLRPELLAQRTSRERFQREIESVARMQHPAIVPVFASSSADEPPYFTMEYVPGSNLAEILAQLRRDGTSSSNADPAALGQPASPVDWSDACTRVAIAIGEALEHAHERGVLHRDVKPSNILLGADGIPRLVDFGLASLEGAQELTHSQSELGSLPYTPPESLRGPRPIPSASLDVYGLGVTLLEMLALENPFLAADAHSTRQRIVQGLPGRWPKLRCRWELETVCRKATDPDPGRRYRDMGAFVADLERCLRRERIAARRASASLRTWRFLQRHPAWSIAAAIAVVCVAVGASILAVQELRARRQGQRLTREARRATYAATVQNAAFYLRERPDATTARRRLLDAPAEYRGWEWRHLMARIEHRFLAAPNPARAVRSATWATAAGLLAVAASDGASVRLAGADGERPAIKGVGITDVHASDSGRLLIAAEGGGVTEVDLSNPSAPAVVRRTAEGPTVDRMAWLDADRFVVALADGTVEWRGPGDTLEHTHRAHDGRIRALAVDLEGERIATGGIDGVVVLMHSHDGSELARIELGGAPIGVHSVSLHGGRRLAAVWGTSGRLARWIEGVSLTLGENYGHCAFGPDGRLAAVWRGSQLRVFDAAQGRRWHSREFADPKPSITALLWPREDEIVSIGRNGITHSFDASRPPARRTMPAGVPRPIGALALDPRRGEIWVGDYGGHLAVVGLANGTASTLESASPHRDRVISVRSNATGTRMLTASRDGVVAVWDMTTRTSVWTRTIAAGLGSAEWHADGQRVALGTRTGDVEIAGVGGGEAAQAMPKLHPVHVTCIAVDASGERMASASSRRILCSNARGEVQWRIERAHEGWVSALAYSPDGGTVASAGADGDIELWDAATGHHVRTLLGHRHTPLALAFTADGTRLVSAGGYDREIMIWSIPAGDHLLSLTPPFGVHAMSVGDDAIVAGGMGGTIECWTAAPLSARAPGPSVEIQGIDPLTPPPWSDYFGTRSRR